MIRGRSSVIIRGDVIRRPKPFRPGDPVPGAKRLNELADPLTRLGRPAITNSAPPPPAPYLQVYQARLNFILGDYLQVRELTVLPDGTEIEGPVDILVAKPWTLRRTPFDGQVFNNFLYTYIDQSTRDATDQSPPGKTERQVITPQYYLNSTIYCVRTVRGGTSVSLSIQGLDLNVDARAWATDDPV